jgi:multiple sugar transport system substrate-binding protein
MLKKIPLRALLALLILSLVLAACSSGTSEEATPAEESTTTEETTTDESTDTAEETTGEKAVVNLWHTIPVETEEFLINDLMPTYYERNPNCEISVRNLGVEDSSIIRTGLALGVDDPTRPHIWWVASSETGAYVEADVLADVDGWLNDNPEIKDSIIPALLELSTYDGKVRSLPWMTNNTAMWINTDAFDAAGVPVPSQNPEETWTWEEFTDAIQKVTEANEGMKGFLVTVNQGWDFWTFHAWYAAAGGDLSAGIPDFASDAALQTVQLQKDLLSNEYASTTTTGWDAAPWYAGEVAVMANGPWNFPALSAFEDFNFTVVPYPRDARPAANLGGNQLFIGKTPTPEQEACAFAFGEYMLTQEFQVAFQKQSGNLPVTTAAAESEEYLEHLASYPFLAGFVNQTPYGVARYPIPEFADIGNAFVQAWDDVMLNDADPAARFADLQSEVDGILGQ